MSVNAKVHARKPNKEAERIQTVCNATLTTEERTQRIQALARRVQDYIQFMCQAANQESTSMAVREKALAAFHEQLVLVEQQLGRIHDAFQLE